MLILSLNVCLLSLQVCDTVGRHGRIVADYLLVDEKIRHILERQNRPPMILWCIVVFYTILSHYYNVLMCSLHYV